MTANSSLVPGRVTVVEHVEAHLPGLLTGDLGQGGQTRVIQPPGLADRSTDHQLEELVFGNARGPGGREIRVRDLGRPGSDLAEQATSGGARPALRNARARCSGEARPGPVRMRSCRARNAVIFLSSVSTVRCTSLPATG